MEDIFRFVALRAPDKADSKQAIDLSNPKSDFQNALVKALAEIHQPPPAPNPPPPQPPCTESRSSTSSVTKALLSIPQGNASLTKGGAVIGPLHAQQASVPPPDHVLQGQLALATPPDQVLHAQIAPVPPDPVEAALTITEAYIHGSYGGGFIWDISTLRLGNGFDDFYGSISNGGQNIKLDDLGRFVQNAFNRSANNLVVDPDFQMDKTNIFDSIIAIFIRPIGHANPIIELTQIARLINLIERIANQDISLNDPGAVLAALSKTVLLPTAIFPLRPDLPKPVGVGDLLVVKQHLKRYELGEIANIENILRGESRNKVTKHTLTLDRTLVTETEKTTETTTELTTTERFELKTEAENTVKEDINVHAGMSVSAKFGEVLTNANADFAYGLSKSQSTKAARDHAKDVTSRAASKVTERVRQQVTSRTIETFEEDEEHGFDNKGGQNNVSGVYQWVNKVYEAQVFNYGSRLLFDLMIPEPAAFLLDAVATKDQKDVIKPPEPFVLVVDRPEDPLTARPVKPDDLGPDGLLKPDKISRPVTPHDLSETLQFNLGNYGPVYYGYYVAKYGAAGVKAPPEPTMTVSKALTGTKDDQGAADDIPIPVGYQAVDMTIQGAYTVREDDTEDGDEGMYVFVGQQKLVVTNGPPEPIRAHSKIRLAQYSFYETGKIPIAVVTRQAGDFAVTVDVNCTRTEAALDQWKIDTHSAIMNAYAKLLSDYQDKRAAQTFQKAAQTPLGGNPDQNRIIERTELKKSCIARLAGTDIYEACFCDIKVQKDPDPCPDPCDSNVETVADHTKQKLFPRPYVHSQTNPRITGGDQGAFIRFFEQAFEWEHMMYLFYPYYWGRRENWYDSALLDNPDPLFAEFLKAGAARAVIPVRLQMEPDVRYFLMTGRLWQGGGLPEVTDTDYLPITEEIRARDNAPGDEIPQGDPWEVVLPTTLIKLRDDDSLPIWKKFVHDGTPYPEASDDTILIRGQHFVWVPGRMQAEVSAQTEVWVPDYGTFDRTSGNWSPP